MVTSDQMQKLFPAHAGVILADVLRLRYPLPFPRTRGGDPLNDMLALIAKAFSPHTRG